MSRLAKRLIGEAAVDTLIRDVASKAAPDPKSQKWAIVIMFGNSFGGYLKPTVHYVGGGGYDIDGLYVGDIQEKPVFYSWGEANAVKGLFREKYGHKNWTMKLKPESHFRQ
jgi:hypothetical protein